MHEWNAVRCNPLNVILFLSPSILRSEVCISKTYWSAIPFSNWNLLQTFLIICIQELLCMTTLSCVFILIFFGRQMFSKHQYLLKRLVEIVEKYWHLEVTCSFEDFICSLWHLESFGNGHLIWSPSVECFVIDIFSRSCVQEMLQDEESCNSTNLVDWFWLALLKFMLN